MELKNITSYVSTTFDVTVLVATTGNISASHRLGFQGATKKVHCPKCLPSEVIRVRDFFQLYESLIADAKAGIFSVVMERNKPPERP